MNVNIFLLVAAGLFFVLSKVISAYRLNFFFRAQGISLVAGINLPLYWLGMFYNLFLPGGIGGDGYKLLYLRKRYNTPVKKSLIALVLDRITGLYALVMLCLVFLFFIPVKGIHTVYIALTIVILTIGLYFVVYKWFGQLYNILTKTNIQSLGVQLSQVITAWLLLFALGGEQSFPYLFVFLVSSVIAVIPFTIGGIGARELTFLYAAEIFHLDVTISVVLSMLFFLITAAVSLFGIIFVLKPGMLTVRNYSGN
jgi:hypothetical protein